MYIVREMLRLQYLYNTFTTNHNCQVVTGGQDSNFSDKFKLKTRNNLSLKICYENIMNVSLLVL